MGRQQQTATEKKNKPLSPPEKTIKAVPRKTRRKKALLGARIVTREGGFAPEASLSYGPLKLSGGAVHFSSLGKTYGFGNLAAGFGASYRHIGLQYKGALAYGTLGTRNIITAHNLGASFNFSIGKSKVRLAAAITPFASYQPVFIESQWGAGASVKFFDRFRPYAIAGGRMSSGSPVHAKTYEYLVPRYENLILGAQYSFRRIGSLKAKGRIEAELSPFYKGGFANISLAGAGWSFGIGAGGRKWHDDLFAGKAEPVLKALFSYDFSFGKRIAARAEVDVQQRTLDSYNGSVVPGKNYTRQSLTEIVGKSVPGDHDSSTYHVFLFGDFTDFKKGGANEMAPGVFLDIMHTHDSLVGYFGRDFLAAIYKGYLDDMAKASVSLTTRDKIIRASFLAQMMGSLTYDPDYDTIGRPREVYGKGPEQFLTDMQEVLHRGKEGRQKLGWLNPKTSCNEIHATATSYLRKSGVKAFTLSTATEGWNWHVISAAVGDDGLYLIDYGDIYRTYRYDIGLLLQSYAKEKGQVILGSYIFTDTDYLGLYITPEGELVKGVIGIDHYKELGNMLGIDR